MSVSEELHRLLELRDRGELTPAEFAALKNAVIEKAGQKQALPSSQPSTFRAAGETELRGELRRQRWELHHPQEAQAMDLARWVRSLPQWGRILVGVLFLAPFVIIALILLVNILVP